MLEVLIPTQILKQFDFNSISNFLLDLNLDDNFSFLKAEKEFLTRDEIEKLKEIKENCHNLKLYKCFRIKAKMTIRACAIAQLARRSECANCRRRITKFYKAN